MGKPFCAFHVSGGTTEVLYVTPTEDSFAVEQVGGTADINAGQAIDRVGVMLGLRFPCGPALELLAAENTKKVPKPRITVRDGVCNLSGLENLAKKLYEESGDRALTAAYVLTFIGEANMFIIMAALFIIICAMGAMSAYFSYCSKTFEKYGRKLRGGG